MAIYTVADIDGLYDALAKAQGGDEIQLAPGDYGNLYLGPKSGFDVTFDSEVTITSQDADNPASFSGMKLDQVSNLTFSSLVFDYTAEAGAPVWTSPFEVFDSSNIVIKDSLFDGDLATGLSAVDDGYGTGKGLYVRGSSGVVIENNEFTTWHRGLLVTESEGITVSENDIHSIRSDGMNFAEVQGVLIEGNYIHDFAASEESSDHADMIQFWTNGTDSPSTDIVIRNNVLDIGEGSQTQSIFMRNEQVDRGVAGEEFFYQNILIEENTILNAHSHGITVGETSNLTIRNNTLLSVDPESAEYFSAPRINLAADSTSVTVTGNATAGISGTGDSSEFTVQNNAFIQNGDPGGIGYYGDLFLESSQGRAVDFSVTSGSMLDLLGAGSSQIHLDTAPDQLTPQFDVFSGASGPSTLVFDATHTYGPDGQVLSEDAQFIWDFGDGTVKEGLSGTHTYAQAGQYDVKLTVVMHGTQQTAAAQATVGIAGDDVLAFNAETGAFESFAYGQASTIEGMPGAIGNTLDLGGTGTALEIDESNFSRFFGAESFGLSMTLEADQPGVSKGEVARVHGSFVLSVQQDGDVEFLLVSETGQSTKIVSNGIPVNDGNTHDISIQLQGDTDTLVLMIDGQVAAAAQVTEPISTMGSWGLTFGNPWGKENFSGALTAFDLKAVSTNYGEYQGTVTGFTDLEGNISTDPSVPLSNESGEGADTPLEPGTGSSSQDQEDEAFLPDLDDYILEATELTAKQIYGDAQVLGQADDIHIALGGGKDHVRLGRLEEFEDTDELAFSVAFSKANAEDGDMRLIWNHMHIGLAVEEDGLRVFLGQADKQFHKSVLIDDLGLDDTELHEARVIVDDVSDTLQVVLDGELVHHEQGQRDIETSGANDGQWGWTIGSAWSHQFEGEVHDFRLEAEAEFLPVSDDLIIA